VRHARTLPLKERYDYLYDWVMPNPDHWRLRTIGDLTPANPAPPARDELSVAGDSGGQIVSPLLELIDTAKELGRSEQLISRFQGYKGGIQERLYQTALALTLMSVGDIPAAAIQIDLIEKQQSSRKDFVAHHRWPELLIASRAIDHPELVTPAFRILQFLILKQIQAGKEGDIAWAQHVRSVHAEAEDRMLGEASASNTMANIKHWKSVVHPRAESNGIGMTEAKYRLTAAGEVIHGSGFDEDYLYFDVPLEGDFQIDCELTSFGYRETTIGYAGYLVQPVYTFDKYDVIGVNQPPVSKSISPGFDVGNWFRYRLVVKGDTATSYVNDREFYKTTVPKDRDPWLYVRSYRWCHGGIRNFKISGTPSVPESISMIKDEELTGWSSRYYSDSLGPVASTDGQPSTTKNNWYFEDGVLKGSAVIRNKGNYAESLVQYHRPMLEDGSIEYRFSWEPGVQEVHPVLDKCVFYLTPEKVRIHWLTDGKYDRTGLAPDNMHDESDHQLVDTLPFREKDNVLRLELKGKEATIVLNGTPVFRRPMERDNRRLFGLFRYKGDSMAWVKDMTWKGNWPKQLPDQAEQPFGGDPVEKLLASVADLKASYECDLTKSTAKEMGLRGFDVNFCKPSADGLIVTGPCNKSYKSKGIGATKGLQGDFDVTLEFADLILPKPDKNASWLRLWLRSDPTVESWGGLIRYPNNDTRLRFERQMKLTDNTRLYETLYENESGQSGRLRLIRKGGEVWLLVSLGESESWRLVESYVIGTGDVPAGLVQANVLSSHTDQQTSVVLKKLTLKADAFIE